jgi:hypothetical protein
MQGSRTQHQEIGCSCFVSIDGLVSQVSLIFRRPQGLVSIFLPTLHSIKPRRRFRDWSATSDARLFEVAQEELGRHDESHKKALALTQIDFCCIGLICKPQFA